VEKAVIILVQTHLISASREQQRWRWAPVGPSWGWVAVAELLTFSLQKNKQEALRSKCEPVWKLSRPR